MTTIAEHATSDLLAAIAARRPAPGGGAVASLAGALAAAVGQMALNYTIGPKTPDNVRPVVQAAIDRLSALVDELLRLGDQDAEAYAEMNRLQKLPADDPERVAGWLNAVRRCTGIPLSVADLSGEILRQLGPLARICSRWLVSDLAISAILAEAAVRSAVWNVNVNLGSIESELERGAFAAQRDARLAEAHRMFEQVHAVCKERSKGS